MHFTIMIYETEESFAARSDPAHRTGYWNGTRAWLDAVREAGILAGGSGMAAPETALPLNYSGGRRSLRNGTVVQARDKPGGCFVINVADMESAIRWARCFPERPGTSIEIRPAIQPD